MAEDVRGPTRLLRHVWARLVIIARSVVGRLVACLTGFHADNTARRNAWEAGLR
ncbi:hypothetical protein [Actinopolymorpha pittospori]|uniref:Uncharacterized protein n=1 Tax=Actinopolymorpha pittospori TaxID=648752 RepID=A0A927MP22_9ACTN|nr:hypothetical protein [Actinopolymorpha pittospori]MBE1603532.1 hypothetical protein [Actinopolymorpha pittospori]